jgi:energy-converting hydrogenase Eha subunit G
MNISRDISSALRRGAAGLAFNLILVGSLAVVRGPSPWLLSLVVVGLGLAIAAGVFVALSLGSLQRLNRAPAL